MSRFLENKVIRSFVLRFFAVFVGIHVFFYLFPPFFLQEWVAALTSSWLGHVTTDTLIFIQGTTFEVTLFCTGLTSIAILAGLIFGFELPNLSKKWITLGSGIVLLLGANIIRVYSILWVAQYVSVGAAEVLHMLTWFVMSGIAVYWWMISTRTRKNESWNELGKRLLRAGK